MIKRAHIFISGDVTGVGYRSWAVRNAQSLELVGWVRNAAYNLVEAVFEGEEEKVRQMIEKCHRGPEGAWVAKIELKWQEARGEKSGFKIRY